MESTLPESKQLISDCRGEPWFEDGNIVLLTAEQPTAFRVHRGVLARHSEVFQGMFEMPQPSNELEKYEDCQVIWIYDLPSELSNLITALYDGPKFDNRSLEDFFYLASILRLSTKYFVGHLRTQAIRFLTQTWAHTLDDHDEMVRTALTSPIIDNTTYPYVHPLHVLNLAREVNVQIIVPSALYFLSLYPLTDLLRADHPKLSIKHPSSPSSSLTTEDLKNYTLMFQHRLDLMVYFIRRICGERSALHGCTNNRACSRGFAQLASRLSRSWQIRTGPLHYMLQAVEEVAKDPGMCNFCCQTFRQNVNKFRESVWDELPSVVGLPTWGEMRESDFP